MSGVSCTATSSRRTCCLWSAPVHRCTPISPTSASRARSRRTRGLTATGAFVGSVDYAAPEQIRAEGSSGAGDVYSLGCVAFECLTGEPPFLRDKEVATLWAISATRRRGPSERVTGLSATSMTCWHGRSPRRPRSAGRPAPILLLRCAPSSRRPFRAAQLLRALRAVTPHATSRSVTTPIRTARSTSVARFWLCGTSSSPNASNSALRCVLIESTARNSSPASYALVGGAA